MKSLDNEQVKKAIVNKTNALNPFLLFMNHKISFKTWLKNSKTRLRAQAMRLLNKTNLSQDVMSEDNQPVKHYVSINKETFIEYTSEEDEEETVNNQNEQEQSNEP